MVGIYHAKRASEEEERCAYRTEWYRCRQGMV
jgi:hypothetical protein